MALKASAFPHSHSHNVKSQTSKFSDLQTNSKCKFHFQIQIQFGKFNQLFLYEASCVFIRLVWLSKNVFVVDNDLMLTVDALTDSQNETKFK